MAVSVNNNTNDYINDLGAITSQLNVKPLEFSSLDAALKTESDIAGKSLAIMEKNVERLGKIQDELTGIYTDNPHQKAKLDAAKKANGLTNNAISESVGSLENPVALYELDRKMIRLSTDPVFKEIKRDEAMADVFYKGIANITSPEMKALALKQYTAYKEDVDGKTPASSLSLDAYKDVDVAQAYVKLLDQIAPMVKTDKYETDKYGNTYVRTIEARDPKAVEAAMMEFSKNTVIRNNMMAKGMLDENGEPVKVRGSDGTERTFFDVMNGILTNGDDRFQHFQRPKTGKNRSGRGSKSSSGSGGGSGGGGASGGTTSRGGGTYNPINATLQGLGMKPFVGGNGPLAPSSKASGSGGQKASGATGVSTSDKDILMKTNANNGKQKDNPEAMSEVIYNANNTAKNAINSSLEKLRKEAAEKKKVEERERAAVERSRERVAAMNAPFDPNVSAEKNIERMEAATKYNKNLQDSKDRQAAVERERKETADRKAERDKKFRDFKAKEAAAYQKELERTKKAGQHNKEMIDAIYKAFDGGASEYRAYEKKVKAAYAKYSDVYDKMEDVGVINKSHHKWIVDNKAKFEKLIDEAVAYTLNEKKAGKMHDKTFTDKLNQLIDKAKNQK